MDWEEGEDVRDTVWVRITTEDYHIATRGDTGLGPARPAHRMG